MGLRKAGPEPVGSGGYAHQTSPWEITTRCAPERAALDTNPSTPSPTSAHARSIASVTWSGAWRATYSLRARLYSWLRDFFRRFASGTPIPHTNREGIYPAGSLRLEGIDAFFALSCSDYATAPESGRRKRRSARNCRRCAPRPRSLRQTGRRIRPCRRASCPGRG